MNIHYLPSNSPVNGLYDQRVVQAIKVNVLFIFRKEFTDVGNMFSIFPSSVETILLRSCKIKAN